MYEHRSLRKLLLAVAVSTPLTVTDAVMAGGPIGGKFHQQQQHYGHYPTVWRTWPEGWQPYHNLRRAVPVHVPDAPEELPTPTPDGSSAPRQPQPYVPDDDAAPAPPADNLTPDQLREQMEQQGRPSSEVPAPGTEFEPPAVPGLDDPAPAPGAPVLPPGAEGVLNPGQPSSPPATRPTPGLGTPPAQLPPGMEGLSPDALQRGTQPGSGGPTSRFAPEGADLPSFDQPSPAGADPFQRPDSSQTSTTGSGLTFVAQPRAAMAELRGDDVTLAQHEVPARATSRDLGRALQQQSLRPTAQINMPATDRGIESRNPFQHQRPATLAETNSNEAERLPVLRPAQSRVGSPLRDTAVRTVSHEEPSAGASYDDVVIHAVAAEPAQSRQPAAAKNPLRLRGAESQHPANPLRRN